MFIPNLALTIGLIGIFCGGFAFGLVFHRKQELSWLTLQNHLSFFASSCCMALLQKESTPTEISRKGEEEMPNHREKNVVYESYTEQQCGNFFVRVWRNCGVTFKMGPDIEVKRVLCEVEEDAGMPAKVTPDLILEALSELMDIEAIYILREDGQGLRHGGCKYPDWS